MICWLSSAFVSFTDGKKCNVRMKYLESCTSKACEYTDIPYLLSDMTSAFMVDEFSQTLNSLGVMAYTLSQQSLVSLVAGNEDERHSK